MNRAPDSFIRVSHKDLHAFVSLAARTVGLPDEKADMLAEILVANDLRGTFSHGTQQIATYAILMRDGILNNHPQVSVVRESPVSVLIDGDGGLGYFPAHEGTLKAIEKAKDQGIAVMASRNHGHFGAAGIYSRLGLEHDLVTYVTSGAELNLKEGDSIYAAGGGSPMSFSSPTSEEDPLILDFGAMHDFYSGSPDRNKIARMAPGVVLRSIGLGSICQSWGGLLVGLAVDESRRVRNYEGANQGSLVITFQIGLFTDSAKFKVEMDDYVRKVRKLKPLEGFEQAYLPGGPETERQRSYLEEGIPVGERHDRRLRDLAKEIGIQVFWEPVSA